MVQFVSIRIQYAKRIGLPHGSQKYHRVLSFSGCMFIDKSNMHNADLRSCDSFCALKDEHRKQRDFMEMCLEGDFLTRGGKYHK